MSISVVLLLIIIVLLVLLFMKLKTMPSHDDVNFTVQKSTENINDLLERKFKTLNQKVELIEKEKIQDEIAETSIINNSNHLFLSKFEDRPIDRWKYFLNPYGVISIQEIVSVNLLKADSMLEDWKQGFLFEIFQIIYSNGYTFWDLEILENRFGLEYAGEHFKIGFIIENFAEYEKFKAEPYKHNPYTKDISPMILKFLLRNGKTIAIESNTVLKYGEFLRYYDNFALDEKHHTFAHYSGNGIAKYLDKPSIDESVNKTFYQDKNIFYFSVNDFVKYLDFLGSEYFNIRFKASNKNYSDLLMKQSMFSVAKVMDRQWKIDDTDIDTTVHELIDAAPMKVNNDIFILEDEESKNFYNSKLNEFSSFTEQRIEELLHNKEYKTIYEYCYIMMYYQRDGFECKTDYSEYINLLDKLSIQNVGIACIFKSILFLEGKVLLRDTEKAKELLRKSYNLGLTNPSKKIWDEYRL